jgi:hypothetical protein
MEVLKSLQRALGITLVHLDDADELSCKMGEVDIACRLHRFLGVGQRLVNTAKRQPRIAPVVIEGGRVRAAGCGLGVGLRLHVRIALWIGLFAVEN